MLGTPKRFGQIEDGDEVVVIDHPGPEPQAGSSLLNAPPPHFHHNRKVVCKTGTTELVMPSTGAFRQQAKYVRTDARNVDGLAVFREAK